jgi:hypothetical protein
MDTVIPHLYASAPEALSFAPSLEIRSYLLERDSGNLLLYRPDTVERDVEGVTELGGVSRQYLNHRHEASPVSDWVAATFGAPLFVHEADAPSVSKNAHVAETFSERHRLDGDFEVIPIPGHTPGATAYLWDSGRHRVLFSGDTIYLRRGEWVAAVLDSSDRERYMKSLELLGRLDFDVLAPWAATAGEPYYAVVDRPEAERRIGQILERVRTGGDG